MYKSAGEWILECMTQPRRRKERYLGLFILWVAIVCLIAFAIMGGFAKAWGTECSFYTKDSCIREGTSGIWTSSGERFDETKCTAASWDYPFGTVLRVTNKRNGRTVLAEVTDRGPSRRLYNKGRRLDLSREAFGRIEDTDRGIADVTVEAVK